jgi:glycosyltransferase involved in cell wall biosynthesis
MRRRRPLRIAQAIASGAWGGRERTPVLLARGLRALGHEVAVWADPDFPAAAEARRRGLPVVPFRWRGRLHPGGILQVARELREKAPQVLHLHFAKELWMAVPAAAWAGWRGPLFLTKHVGSYVVKKDPLHAWLYRRVDRVLTCSDVIRRNVIATTPVPERKVAVSYAPVDMDAFRFDPVARRRVRRAWGAREGRPVVGMVARLSPGKGHETLLQAAALLRASIPDVIFRMAGDASVAEAAYRERLLRLRDELGLSGAFEFEGYVPDVPAFLSGLDLVVHAAKAEAFGLAAVEAMACGRPVVGRAGEGLDEIIVGGKGGVLVGSDDPARWAAVMRDVLTRRSLHLRLAYQARRAAERFSLERLTKDHEKAYDVSLAEKGILVSSFTTKARSRKGRP